MSAEDDEINEIYGDDDRVSFPSGECECEHEPDRHGWMGCRVEGCHCEASWEE